MMSSVGKKLQRHVFTLLGTRWGLGLLLLISFVTLNSVLHAAEKILKTSIVCPKPASERDFNDNIARRSYEGYLCQEPIDVVYTWVNGSDPWMKKNVHYFKNELLVDDNSTFDETKTSASRFQDNQEMRYSFRSLVRNAGWVRHIYVVTNGQIPSWLNIDNPKITIVPHHQIYPNVSHVPVFASPSIECHLHRIPGLSRRFIYMNDDVFFGRPIHPEDFYSNVDGHRIYLSWPVPNCAEGCPSTWVGDGYCDRPCNCTECDYDGGDCVGKNAKTTTHNVPSTTYSSSTRVDQCGQGCPDNWLGDKFCDRNCNNAACGFDAVDCSIEDVLTLNMLHVTREESEYTAPAGAKAFAVNLTAIFDEEDTITAGDYEASGTTVRLTSVSQKAKIMVVLVREDSPRSVATFTLSGLQADTKNPLFVAFNVTVGGSLPSVTETATLTATGSETEVTVEDIATTASGGFRKLLSMRIAEGTTAYDAVGIGMRMQGEKASDAAERSASQLVEPQAGGSRTWSAKKAYLKHKIFEREKQEDRNKEDWRALENLWREQYGSILTEEELRETTWSTRRKLLDTFGDSLKYVNRLMNTRFGNSARKVPAHMPHFIDSQVVREMHEQWNEQFEETSANRFRSPLDMQFSFTHMYWVTHATNAKNSFNFFIKNLDLNENGVLDKTEYRRTAVMLWEGKVTQDDMRAVLDAPDLVPEEPVHSDEAWRFSNIDESMVARWRANLTGESFNPDVDENVVTQELAETKCADSHEADSDSGAAPVLSPFAEEIIINNTHLPTITQLANTPLVCSNQSIEVNRNGSIVYEMREVCERVVEVPPEAAPVEPPVYVWKPPSEDDEPTMPAEYMKLVTQLIELAAAGVGVTRYIRPSLTGKLTAYHFNDSHLAAFLQRGEEEMRYKHVVMPEDEISFFMIRENATVVQRQMDHMLWKRSKFMCINDNMNHSDPENQEVITVLHTFMKEYFPIETEFEHPEGVENTHLHTFEYSPEKQAQYGWYTPKGLHPVFAASMETNGESQSYLDIFRRESLILYTRHSAVSVLCGVLIIVFAAQKALSFVISVVTNRAPPPPLPSGLLGR
eukprot:TRINITY_DN17370_c0_g1_i1.p1 TRINITY_DN17370_c0_g1~~TRINITY_DN17370_c0_g1_i1.p1  ORF type:complete len:1079 (+),score=253.70 TRINITY_DN17370_c0_g1_i1:51-3287(+)